MRACTRCHGCGKSNSAAKSTGTPVYSYTAPSLNWRMSTSEPASYSYPATFSDSTCFTPPNLALGTLPWRFHLEELAPVAFTSRALQDQPNRYDLSGSVGTASNLNLNWDSHAYRSTICSKHIGLLLAPWIDAGEIRGNPANRKRSHTLGIVQLGKVNLQSIEVLRTSQQDEVGHSSYVASIRFIGHTMN